MGDIFETNWIIREVEWADTDNLQGVINSIHFLIKVKHPETGVEYHRKGSYADLDEPDSDTFVAKEQLSDEIVMSWIPAEYVTEMSEAAERTCMKMVNERQGKGKPWESN